MQGLGFRGRHDSRQLEWGGDISLKSDEEGTKYSEFNMRITKTRTGENLCNISQFSPNCSRQVTIAITYHPKKV